MMRIKNKNDKKRREEKCMRKRQKVRCKNETQKLINLKIITKLTKIIVKKLF